MSKNLGDMFEDLRTKLSGLGNEVHLETRTIEIAAESRVWEFVNFLIEAENARPQGKSRFSPAQVRGAVLTEGIRAILNDGTLEAFVRQLEETPILELVTMFHKGQALKKYYTK